MNWRKLNRRVHQDLGYLSVGLTLIYTVSGIALNHLHQWNPDLVSEKYSGTYAKNISFVDNQLAAASAVVGEAGISYPVKSVTSRGRAFKIFLDVGKGNTGSMTVDPNSKTFNVVIQKQRPVFKSLNLLHRNNAKRLWTWVSDIYAVGLILLAISGIIIMRGKFGFKRYGVWFVAAGIVIPLVIFYIYF